MRLYPRFLHQIHRIYVRRPLIHNVNHLYLRNNIVKKYSTSYELNLKIKDVSATKYLQKLEEEYNNANKTKEDGRTRYLQNVIDVLTKRNSIIENLKNIQDILDQKDEELIKLAEEEQKQYENELKQIDEELQSAILPQDDTDCNAIVLEINAGVGGQEAMLFASELFEMYSNFAEYKGWKCITAEYLTTDLGGIRHGSLLIKGDGVFSYFKHEAGVHRVQRIPETEKAGRIHTSTVSVNALPQPNDIQINIQSKDLKIETKRATGAGGQHVNTTDSAVRITHLPTGISVECQVDRSQIKNRQMAMDRLRAKLFQLQLDQQSAEISATRKQQVKSNFRNEKIRTYNFSQDRITDHRLQGSNVHNLKVFMLGGEPLEEIIDKLKRQAQEDELLEAIHESNNKS